MKKLLCLSYCESKRCKKKMVQSSGFAGGPILYFKKSEEKVRKRFNALFIGIYRLYGI